MEQQKRTLIANIEIREVNDSNEMIVEGYAATFEQPTVLYKYEGNEYKEVISRGAFDNTDMSDVVLRYNHNDSYPLLARSKNGSLKLSIDDIGLKVEAKLFNTRASQDVYDLVKAGALDKMSFAFTINKSSYDRDLRTRSIEGIDKLYDVAIVDVPAYESTSLNARKLFDGNINEEDEENEKTKLKIKIKLL